MFLFLFSSTNSVEGGASSEEAHRRFMENYKDMFVSSKQRAGMLPAPQDQAGAKSLGTTNLSTGIGSIWIYFTWPLLKKTSCLY